MRVVLYLAPHAIGGIETMVRVLATGLQQRGVTVSAAAMVPPGGPGLTWVEELRNAGIEVDVLPPTPALHRDLAGLRAVLAARQADLLHAHGYRADILGALLPASRQVATVATLHGFSPTDWKGRWYTRFDRLALRRFDAVIAVSAPIRDTLVRSGVSQTRVHVLHNGVDVPGAPEPRVALRAALQCDDAAFVIGTVGRLSLEKGHRILLTALAEARRDYPQTVLVLAGDGPERDELERLAHTLGLTASVRFLGQRRDLERVYPAFDLFVLSSLTEGSPTALLEASAYGVPTLASRVGAIPDMLKEGSEIDLVPPGDAAALAAALRRLAGDATARRRLGQAARTRYDTEYRLSPWLDRVQDIYSTVVSSRTARAR